ncbi:MAG: FtsX-like permease family protein [Myxococcaceae bacterium]
MTAPSARARWLNGAGALLLTGASAVAVGVVLARASLAADALWSLLWMSVGVGPIIAAIRAVLTVAKGQAAGVGVPGLVWLGGALGVVAMVLWGFVLRTRKEARAEPSAAVGAPLYAPLARYRDFYWSTLAAYGGGILAAEIVVVFLQTWLASPRSGRSWQLAPTSAFVVALAIGATVAFVGGFLGATRARRLAAPEATLGLLYFGLPIPAALTAISLSPALQLRVGPRLREVVYVAELLGRPEVGYWVVFFALVVALLLGTTTGFVATGSGALDLRTGFERYVAKRHVEVFRPSLLLGVLAVLMFGIVPPLLLYAMLRATDAAVERTRIRELGLRDPLLAAAAQDAAKRREQSPTAMMTALSVGGVGVGVMALIIVLSVMSGFEADLQQKILGTNAHAVVLKYADKFPEYRDTIERVRRVRGVVGTTPFIINEVMLSSEGNIAGVMIKGIDPETVGTVTDLPSNVLPGGSMNGLADPKAILPRRLAPGLGPAVDERPANAARHKNDPLVDTPTTQGAPIPVLPGILLGRELATQMRVVVGDRVNVVSPLGGELGPQGPTPKSRPFRVAGIFYSGMYEYDSKFVYVALREAEAFFGMTGPTGIELKVADIDDARRVAQNVLEALEGYPYRTKDWGEMNRNLFSALRLEKLVMGIILSIIVIVAAGLIVATVIMLVLEKRKEISVLKALGVPDAGIVKIFLAEGLQIGIAGGLLGLVSGLAWCVFIERVGIKLDPEVYYIPALPVRIEPMQTALAVIIAVLITYLASIYPALKASRVEPVEGLKAE